MKMPEPTEQHKWLQWLVGNWEQEPAQDGSACGPWNEKGRMIGDLWVQLSGEMPMPDGSKGETLMTLGFDPESGRFRGTWIGSMMTHLWVYDGELNAEGTTLSLHAKGPDFTDPKKMRSYKDVLERLPDGRRKLSSHMLGDDGTWTQFMESISRRV